MSVTKCSIDIASAPDAGPRGRRPRFFFCCFCFLILSFACFLLVRAFAELSSAELSFRRHSTTLFALVIDENVVKDDEHWFSGLGISGKELPENLTPRRVSSSPRAFRAIY